MTGLNSISAVMVYIILKYPDPLCSYAWSNSVTVSSTFGIICNIMMNMVFIYLQVGDYESAQAVHEEMLDIDPQHWSIGWTDFVVNMSRGNHAGAIEAGKWALPKLGNKPQFQLFIAYAFAMAGQYSEARDLILQANPRWGDSEQWSELFKTDSFHACLVAGVFAGAGDTAKAQKLMDEAVNYYAEFETKIERAYTLAPIDCWVARGDHEKALDMLDTWNENDFYAYWWFTYQWPWWDDLRSEPRFQAAMQTIEEKVAKQRSLIDQMNL